MNKKIEDFLVIMMMLGCILFMYMFLSSGACLACMNKRYLAGLLG